MTELEGWKRDSHRETQSVNFQAAFLQASGGSSALKVEYVLQCAISVLQLCGVSCKYLLEIILSDIRETV